MPTVEIFLLEKLSSVVTVEVQKFGSNNVDLKSIAETTIAEQVSPRCLKSIAEMSHCVLKHLPQCLHESTSQ